MLGVQQTFDDLGAPLHAVPFVVLDLETTGTSPGGDAITEIGAVRYLGGELTGTFHTLIDPGTDIPPLITVLTGITTAMVVGAPRIEEALPSLLEFIGDAVIVGHNVRFDKAFLDAASARLGYRLPNRTADTCALARRLLNDEVGNHRLATLATHLRSPVTPIHRALDDARATAHVFFELLARAGTIGVVYLEDLMRLPTARGAPHYGKLRLTDRLPRKPGVYLFRGATGEVIYIGKAKDLRSRVRSYFYGDSRRRMTQMMRQLATVDHQVCATEIDAAVTEIRLIDRYAPQYNRRSRPSRSIHWVRLTDERFPRLSVVRTQQAPSLAHLGPFRHKATALAVVHAIWDAIPLRRCVGSGGRGCRFAELGVAVCPCDGSVDPADYRRLTDAILTGIDAEPGVILDPLRARMEALAAAQRFEEAAEIRDRYRALGRALETRRMWRRLTAAGMVWAEDDTGETVAIDGASLAEAWVSPSPPPLLAPAPATQLPTETPPTPLAAEELRLLWKWLDRPGVSVTHSTAPFVPGSPVPVAIRLSVP